jgi:hypothetical protein
VTGFSNRKLISSALLGAWIHKPAGKLLCPPLNVRFRGKAGYNEVTVQQPKHTIEMAHECGLDSGAEWGTPDTGHFEVPTEGYGTRIARSDATGYGGILSYASSKIQEFWNWSVH